MKKRVQKSVLITQSGPGLKKTKTQTFCYLIENSSVLNDFFGNGGPSLSIYTFFNFLVSYSVNHGPFVAVFESIFAAIIFADHDATWPP